MPLRGPTQQASCAPTGRTGQQAKPLCFLPDSMARQNRAKLHFWLHPNEPLVHGCNLGPYSTPLGGSALAQHAADPQQSTRRSERGWARSRSAQAPVRVRTSRGRASRPDDQQRRRRFPLARAHGAQLVRSAGSPPRLRPREMARRMPGVAGEAKTVERTPPPGGLEASPLRCARQRRLLRLHRPRQRSPCRRWPQLRQGRCAYQHGGVFLRGGAAAS
jgi:hypothetical protein